MGKRKAISAAARKEAKMARSEAILRHCPLSPRKVRLVADMVRRVEVSRALSMLRYDSHGGAPYVEKVLLSAVNNWEQKHPGVSPEDVVLEVKTIMVDEGRTLKRIRPRAQGRANRILKRSCHIYVEVAERAAAEAKDAPAAAEAKEKVTE
ncbi:MAG: 50S ribosomal protein L22 [Bacteroidetes bacterium]|nr:MAG: 50S ribosomal protein L22 [Bacteroidota bacterium]